MKEALRFASIFISPLLLGAVLTGHAPQAVVNVAWFYILVVSILGIVVPPVAVLVFWAAIEAQPDKRHELFEAIRKARAQQTKWPWLKWTVTVVVAVQVAALGWFGIGSLYLFATFWSRVLFWVMGELPDSYGAKDKVAA